MIELIYRRNGFILRVEGIVDMEQMRVLTFQIQDEFAGIEGEFILLIDARTLKHFTADAQAAFQELLETSREQGMVRLTVLGISTALASLFCSIMVQADMMDHYQFLDLAYESDWKAEMKSWLDAPFLEDA